MLLPELAEQLGVRYHRLYRTARWLGMTFGRHPTSRKFEVSSDDVQRLHDEHERVRALHQRSIKVAAAARRLGVAVSTITVMAKRGDLDVDPETDGSTPRFVTRASVDKQQALLAHEHANRQAVEAVPLADIARFTGRSRTELLDPVRTGTLEQLPGRGPVRTHSREPPCMAHLKRLSHPSRRRGDDDSTGVIGTSLRRPTASRND